MITLKKIMFSALIISASVSVLASPQSRRGLSGDSDGSRQFRPPIQQDRRGLSGDSEGGRQFRPPMQQGGVPLMEIMTRRLDLTPEQQKKLESAVKDILTPEQNARMQEIKKNFRQHAAKPDIDRPQRMPRNRHDLRESERPGYRGDDSVQKMKDRSDFQKQDRAMRPQRNREDSCTDKAARHIQPPRAKAQPQMGNEAQNAERLNYMFDKADADGDGLVSKDELRKFFGARQAQSKERRQ